MPTLSHDFEVYCTCGNGICNQTGVDDKRQHIIVEPCKKCMQEKDSEIYDLKEEVKDLQQAIDELKAEIKDLEANTE